MAIQLADLMTPKNLVISALPLIAFAALCVVAVVGCAVDVVSAYRDMEELERENDGE